MRELKENIIFINSILLQNPLNHHDLPKSDKKLIKGSLFEIFQILLKDREGKSFQVTFKYNMKCIRIAVIGSEFLSTIDIIDPDIINHFFFLYDNFQQKLKNKIRKEKLNRIGI